MRESVTRTIQFDPLPGCQPYLNERLMRVRQAQDGLALIEYLREFHPPTPREHWLQWIDDGDITLNNSRVQQDTRVRVGQRYRHAVAGYTEPPVRATIGVIYEDESLLVVDKPAPLPVHPSGRFNRNTLSSLLTSVYPHEKLRISHRLDANTTGVVVFCRTSPAASSVQQQFQHRQVEKFYLARVIGHVPFQTYVCELKIGTAHSVGGTDTGGARTTHDDGQPAETLFHCLNRFDDETSLLQVKPITGRTNQIRVHAAAMGFPVMGDPFYERAFDQSDMPNVSPTQTLTLDAPPMCLHAWRISLKHPITYENVSFESPPPVWAGDRRVIPEK
jgi:23S rRNA pseudouridine1911/1915/1917 synthase